jgi:translation initiation factor 4E
MPEPVVTVVENSSALTGEDLVSAPLSNPWALWVMSQHGKTAKDNWQASQTKTAEFATVGDFWRLYNNIHSVSKLGHADYAIFRQGVAPAWEDPVCKNGGRWVAKITSRPDDAWLTVLLALIGESFGEYASIVCGAVFSARRGGMKLALWLSSSDEEKVLGAGRLFRSVIVNACGEPEDFAISFESFSHASESPLKL